MPMLEAHVSTQQTVQGEALSAESVPHRAPMSSVVLHVSFNNFCFFYGQRSIPNEAHKYWEYSATPKNDHH